MNSFMKQKQTHGHKIQSTVTKGEGGGINQELGINIYARLYIYTYIYIYEGNGNPLQ